MSEEQTLEDSVKAAAFQEKSNPSVDLSNPEIKKLVESMVSEELSSIKTKLNDAYSARDEAIKAKTAFEDEKKTAELKRMEDEGRHKEAGDLRIAELNAKLESANRRNTELTRDHQVTSALNGMDFRNEMASEMARDRITSQMIQDEHGQWRHKTGVTIREFAEHFKKDDDNSFLFRPKTNSGVGSVNPAGAPDMTSTKPITSMDTAELLAHFSQGAPKTGNF